MLKALTLLALPLIFGACGGDGARGGTPGNRIADADGNLGPWIIQQHPCVENRTDALWIDDASTAFVGCGSGANGRGMFKTTDGGATWTIPDATGNVFASMRVNSISRGPDDILYVAGTGSNGSRVISYDGVSAEIYYGTPAERPQPWQTFQVGTFRVDGNDRAVAESLTGTDVIYWPEGADEGVNGDLWWRDAGVAGGAQILDLEVWDDRFFGSGSTISQPPYFFFEPDGGMGDEFEMEAIQLSGEGLEAFSGEAWDLDIDDDGNGIIAGVNQGPNVGVLWYSTGDITVASNWQMYDISPLIFGERALTTRFYGSCREGDTMAAVGDYSTRDEALVVLSTDGGTTWNTFTPPGTGADAVGSLSTCTILDGDLFVAGAAGFFGILNTTVL
jgi:hypothetical protein